MFMDMYFKKRGDNHIKLQDVIDVATLSRLTPQYKNYSRDVKEVGKIFGLGVYGFLGSVLEIEAVAFKKDSPSGSVRFNDTAGSMAKDSVFNAATVIRKITGEDLSYYDVHVNVVGGGNIDGPSAGLAITLSILSAIQNRPIRQDIAVTGEISLSGHIKPVGGILEKIYGAVQGGIKNIIIPKENIKDVPFNLDDVNVIAVDNIEEVLEIVY